MTHLLPIVGWQENVSLPNLGISQITAKLDTGAASSSLHASNIEVFEEETKYVRFNAHINSNESVRVVAPILGYRRIRSSCGTTEVRPIIQTLICMGNKKWSINISLSSRENMRFNLLLGRQALRRKFVIDASRRFLLARE